MSAAQGRLDALRGRGAASRLGEPQHLVVSRSQLAAAGVPRWLVRLELRVGRWRTSGRQVVVLHNGPLSEPAIRAAAVLSVGSAAALDGVSALQAAGAERLTSARVVVSTPKGSTPVRRLRGVELHETRRFREEDVLTSGIRRLRPAAAAVHAALWAASDRQATLFMTLAVQQGLAPVAEIAEVLSTVKRDKRRRMLTRLLVELAGGAGSLSELDVAAGLRRRGLPEPTRQAVRFRPNGKEYLDFEFLDYDVVLEVDGAGHDEALQRLSDTKRDIRHAAEGKTALRIPLIAWRLDEEAVLDALEELFRSRGWRHRAA